MTGLARIFAVALLVALPAAASVQAGDIVSPVGQWEVSTGESRYRISYCGEQQELCAVLTWLREDVRSADNLALLDSYVVRGARHEGGGNWSGEVIFEGQTHAGTMTLLSANAMRVVCCVAILCKSYELNRL
jgi:uncharacterized protein (DUF2147 family)